MDPRLVRTVRRFFARFGYRIERFDPANPDPWSKNESFLRLYGEIESRTLVTVDRCFALHQYAGYASGLDGEFAEVGAYRGGTARLLARACPATPLHLFDTFDGMPAVHPDRDVHKTGDFANTSLQEVSKFLSDCPNVAIHAGRFPDTASGLVDSRFSLVHVDADIYQSVKDCLDFYYPRMTPGGVMLFDDYEWQNCPGVKIALDEFTAQTNERAIVTTRYQCALIKRVV